MLSRSIKQAVAVPRRLGLSAANQIRCETTSANVPADAAQAQKKDSHQLVVSEPTEILTADVISGAPSKSCNNSPFNHVIADYVQAMQLKFRTKEDAIHFAEKQGWDYYVQQPTVKRIPPKNYSENYSYSPGKIKQAHTK
ncbi:hypothetical protein FRC00_004215 [Tulasnella sp. 408]|nr:hypothetical protein FRC00_004215 [Tulasnella sp. 408]